MANIKNKRMDPENIKTILAKVILEEYDKSVKNEEKEKEDGRNENEN